MTTDAQALIEAAAALARAGAAFVDLGITDLLPLRYRLPPRATLGLLAAMAPVAQAAPRFAQSRSAGPLVLPRALPLALRRTVPLLWRPDRANANAVLELVEEPLALAVRGLERCAEGDLEGALADLRLARSRRSMFGTGRGMRLVLFTLLAVNAGRAEEPLAGMLRREAVCNAWDLLGDPRVDRMFVDRLAATAQETGLEEVVRLAQIAGAR